ncbi:MAG TPA: hypothetical protein VFF85_06555 [Microbacterium sp.]|nr:hypothetical protein [Microbacterium sp.]
MSPMHLLIIVASVIVVIVLDVYVFVRLLRVNEGFTGRVIFWALLTLFAPIIGAISVLTALPRSSESGFADS